MIKTKPATKDYRNNFDNIFHKEQAMKRYRVPVDIIVWANSTPEVEDKVKAFLTASLRDLGPTYNVRSYELPVGYPTEEQPLGTAVSHLCL